MKRLIFTLAASLCVASALPQQIHKERVGDGLLEFSNQPTMVSNSSQLDRIQAKASSKITFKANYDAARYTSGYVTVYSGSTKATARINATTGEASIKLPSATWNAVFIFYKLDEAGRTVGLAMVAKENIEITEATTIEANMDDAIHHYQFDCYNYDNTPVKLSTYRMVADETDTTKYNEVLVEKGNALYMRTFTHLWHKDLGSLFYLYSDALGEVVEAPYVVNNPYRVMDVWMNDCSDTIYPMQVRGVQTAPDTYENITIFSEGYENVSTNQNNTFYKIPMPTFEQTWWGSVQEHQPSDPVWAEITQTIGDLSVPKGVYKGVERDGLRNLWISMPDKSAKATGMVTKIQPEYDDAVLSYTSETYTNDDGSTTTYEWIYSAPTDTPELYIDLNGKTAVKPQLEYGYYYMNGLPEDDFGYAHPYVPTWEQFNGNVMGKGMPFAHSFFSGYDGNSKDLIVQFYGSGSTVLNTYYWTSPFSIKYNDATVNTENYESILDWIYSDDVTGKGKYDVEMKSVPGIYDGLTSQVVFKAGFDQSNDDCTSPAVQIADFVNKNGVHTNEFETASDGTFLITAGDFKYNSTDYVFEHVDLKPTVEYAPYGSEAWTVLNVDLDSSVNAAVCYSKSYKASLENITANATQGWFDMRISMTDASGNYMTQTISPAFKIAELSGVATISGGTLELHVANGRIWITGADMPRVDVYALDSSCVKSVYSNELNDLSKGVYIVKVNNGKDNIVRKVLIK
jgi:hypothetical protein